MAGASWDDEEGWGDDDWQPGPSAPLQPPRRISQKLTPYSGGGATMAGAGIGSGGNGYSRNPPNKFWSNLWDQLPGHSQPLLKMALAGLVVVVLLMAGIISLALVQTHSSSGNWEKASSLDASDFDTHTPYKVENSRVMNKGPSDFAAANSYRGTIPGSKGYDNGQIVSGGGSAAVKDDSGMGRGGVIGGGGDFAGQGYWSGDRIKGDPRNDDLPVKAASQQQDGGSGKNAVAYDADGLRSDEQKRYKSQMEAYHQMHSTGTEADTQASLLTGGAIPSIDKDGLHTSAEASSYENTAERAAKGTVGLEYPPVNLEASTEGIQRPPHKITGALLGGLGTEDGALDSTIQASSDAISLPEVGSSSGHLSTGMASTIEGIAVDDAPSPADGAGSTTRPLGDAKQLSIPRSTADSILDTSAGKEGIQSGSNTSSDDTESGGATVDKKSVRVKETGSGGGDAGSGLDKFGEMVTATDTNPGTKKGVGNSIMRMSPASEIAPDSVLADVDDPASAISIQDTAVVRSRDKSMGKGDEKSGVAQAADEKYSFEDSSQAKVSVLARGGGPGSGKPKTGSGISSGGDFLEMKYSSEDVEESNSTSVSARSEGSSLAGASGGPPADDTAAEEPAEELRSMISRLRGGSRDDDPEEPPKNPLRTNVATTDRVVASSEGGSTPGETDAVIVNSSSLSLPAKSHTSDADAAAVSGDLTLKGGPATQEIERLKATTAARLASLKNSTAPGSDSTAGRPLNGTQQQSAAGPSAEAKAGPGGDGIPQKRKGKLPRKLNPGSSGSSTSVINVGDGPPAQDSTIATVEAGEGDSIASIGSSMKGGLADPIPATRGGASTGGISPDEATDNASAAASADAASDDDTDDPEPGVISDFGTDLGVSEGTKTAKNGSRAVGGDAVSVASEAASAVGFAIVKGMSTLEEPKPAGKVLPSWKVKSKAKGPAASATSVEKKSGTVEEPPSTVAAAPPVKATARDGGGANTASSGSAGSELVSGDVADNLESVVKPVKDRAVAKDIEALASKPKVSKKPKVTKEKEWRADSAADSALTKAALKGSSTSSSSSSSSGEDSSGAPAPAEDLSLAQKPSNATAQGSGKSASGVASSKDDTVAKHFSGPDDESKAASTSKAAVAGGDGEPLSKGLALGSDAGSLAGNLSSSSQTKEMADGAPAGSIFAKAASSDGVIIEKKKKKASDSSISSKKYVSPPAAIFDAGDVGEQPAVVIDKAAEGTARRGDSLLKEIPGLGGAVGIGGSGGEVSSGGGGQTGNVTAGAGVGIVGNESIASSAMSSADTTNGRQSGLKVEKSDSQSKKPKKELKKDSEATFASSKVEAAELSNKSNLDGTDSAINVVQDSATQALANPEELDTAI